ncbi:MAG: HD-GYP domain-containing protein, partial [Candidatus Baltobacteraceae bacterium]
PDAAREAIDRVKAVETSLDPLSRRTVRTETNVILAQYILRDTAAADAGLENMLMRLPSLSARSRAFIEAAGAIGTRWSGTLNRAMLHGRFQSMHSRGLGGYAAVLSSLPLNVDLRPPAKNITSSPQRLLDVLGNAREQIVDDALRDAMAYSESTLLSDLIAGGIVEKLSAWVKGGGDDDIVRWAEKTLEEQHSAHGLAQLFGKTVDAAARTLYRHGVLDAETEERLARLRDTLEAHVSAFQVRRTVDEIRPVDAMDAKIDEMLNRLSARDAVTFEHSRCVGAWCARLAKRMHLQRADALLVMRSGLIHDIGKVLTPPEILQAPRALDAAEWITMKRHTLDGVRLLEPVSELRMLIPAVRWHHERYDGAGYPDSLTLQDIPFAARMVAVADAFNAMIARRPYRDPLNPMIAIDQLKRGSGTQFDPAVVDNMIDVVLRPD